MKQGWEIKKLGEVVEVLDNLRKPITKRDRVEGVYPYYGATGVLSFVHNYIFSEKLVLIGEDGAKWASGDKTSFIADGKYWVNNHAHVIRPMRKIILDEWIVYFLNFSDLTKYITGMTVPKLNQEKMRGIEIPLPPLPEQQRIVSILDEAFAAIAKAKDNAEQNLRNAKEVFESYLAGVFEGEGEGWEEKRLGDVVDNIMTGPFGSMLHKSDYVEVGIPVVNPQNLVDGQIIPLQKTMINKATFNRLEKYALKIGDIVIARRGEMGRCAIVKNNNVGWLCGTGSFVIRVNKKKADSEFLNIFLSSAEVKKELEKSSIGATMSNLNQSILSELLLKVPPVIEQQAIVQTLDALSAETKKLEAIYRKKIDDLEEMKKSVLEKAFSGGLLSAL